MKVRGLLLALLVASPVGAVNASHAEHIHTVQPGETLWMVAANHLGDPKLWPVIYRANRDQIQNPDILHAGQRLRVPEVDSETRAAVRREADTLHHTK